MGSAAEYEAVFGLEVHAELLTESKVFCSCATSFGSKPNTQTCPVCLGLPGTLPVLNEKVVEYALRLALALKCKINTPTRFDRKNSYYPDLPKNYQISQNYLPLAYDGSLDIFVDGEKRSIEIDNIHIEEDAGKNLHYEDTGLKGISLIDLNRTGMPLLEIVSKPQMHSLGEVASYMKTLRDILLYVNICDCKMEEGHLRFEANVSLRRAGESQLGVRTEMKNLNSFKMVLDSLSYEIERHRKILTGGGNILQETRLWDGRARKTLPMRGKEEAEDYRYFPEPDLPPLFISKEQLKKIGDSLPELPVDKISRLKQQYELPHSGAEILAGSRPLADFYELTVKTCDDRKLACNWLTGEFLALLKETGYTIEEGGRQVRENKLSPEKLGNLLLLIKKGIISALTGKSVLAEMFKSGKEAEEIISEKGVSQISNEEELTKIVEEVLSKNDKSVRDYHSGKKKALGFLIGQVMSASGGKANPKLASKLLQEMIQQEP